MFRASCASAFRNLPHNLRINSLSTRFSSADTSQPFLGRSRGAPTSPHLPLKKKKENLLASKETTAMSMKRDICRKARLDHKDLSCCDQQFQRDLTAVYLIGNVELGWESFIAGFSTAFLGYFSCFPWSIYCIHTLGQMNRRWTQSDK